MILKAYEAMCYVSIDRGETYGTALTQFLTMVSGKKGFQRDGMTYYFETSQRNIEYWLECFPDCKLVDERLKAAAPSMIDEFFVAKKAHRPPFQFGTEQYKHQERGFAKIKDLPLSALYMGTGTGKTKMSVDKSVYLWCDHKIDALLVMTKKGVHEQWVDEELPKHVHPSIPWSGHAWQGMTTKWERNQFEEMMRWANKLRVFTINIDAISTKKGFAMISEFITRAAGRVYALVDESQDISDPDSVRGTTLQKIRDMIHYRSILSGTPITVNLENIWGQFHFLDTDIIGHKYRTPFRSEYCRMGGFQGKAIVGHRNLEAFYRRIDDVTFRATKEEDLDLPPKVYKNEVFKLTDKQMKIYEELRRSFLVELENGATVTVDHAATMIMRLQQIACGFVTDEDGTVQYLDNPRLDRAIQLDEEIGKKEKKIYWCRFKDDARFLMQAFGSRAVDYVGATADADRARNKALFLDKNSGKDILISNPAAGGTGLNLQGECAYAIYYSNSYNAAHRWQSEDRIHRIGTYKTTYFIDLVASRTVDRRIIQNLKDKRDFAQLVLDDIRKMIAEAA